MRKDKTCGQKTAPFPEKIRKYAVIPKVWERFFAAAVFCYGGGAKDCRVFMNNRITFCDRGCNFRKVRYNISTLMK